MLKTKQKLKQTIIYRILFLMILISFNLVYATSCSNNWVGGSCTGSIIYTQNTILTNNVLNTGDTTINSGVWLTTNGFYTITTGTYTNLGVIFTGNILGSQGVGASQITFGGNATPTAGVSYSNSYGGSGGAGGGCACTDGGVGGNGGSTLVAGGVGANSGTAQSGSTPSSPTLNNGNIQTWTSSYTYMAGGAGGGAEGNVGGYPPKGNGGNSIYGLYIQASTIDGGIIYAYGNNGISEGGGGSGGAFVLFAYNNSFSDSSCLVYGGIGAPLVSQAFTGGNGGAGHCSNFEFTTPPITPYNPAATSTTTITSDNIYPPSLVNATHPNSIPALLSYSLVLPYFAYGIIFLAGGITLMATKRLDNAMLSAFIASLILYFISTSLITSSLVIGLGIVCMIFILIPIFSKK